LGINPHLPVPGKLCQNTEGGSVEAEEGKDYLGDL
jgi:hypothetical protein